MSYHLAPLANEQQVDANGSPVSGGRIWTYIAGTTTPATTYTDDTGGTAQTNPIILNSLGLPANPVWLQSGRSYKFVFTDANDVQTRPTVDDIAGINDVTDTADQWVLYGNAPTYISATSFSVAGDQTGTFQVNRRLKSVNTGGTIYSSIVSAVYAAGITTVTVTNDSGSLDSGMSQVSYGLLSAVNPSIPERSIRSGAAVSASGTSVDFTSIPSWVKRITVSVAGLSTTGASNPMIQIGDSGGIETSGYLGSATHINGGATTSANFTTGFGLSGVVSLASTLHGAVVLTLLDAATNTWVASGSGGFSNAAQGWQSGGSKSLSATLDRIRLTTVGGTETFDAGTVNVLFE